MSTPDKKRRLAAIMFADVAGYTAMMQRNEKDGLAKVKRFNEVMEREVNAYEGEILEFRGDGCMVVFESAVQAMHAAKTIQEQLQKEPIVPLRIGIHIGDIVFTQGNIYGDGVNVASRVESMGVPGAVLVTEQVIHNIKSHPEFEMTSLGRFQFKNVEQPMEVFALANEGMVVPKLEEMKGKGEKVVEKKTSVKTAIRLASFGFLAMAIGAILFWGIGGRSSDSAGLLDKDIREEKVAVAIFENFTGEQNLDAIGYLASEWITSSLREIGIKTVAPEMMRQYKDYVGILPDNPEGKTSLAEVTKAQYVISGSYFPKGDSLRLITRLLDTHTGEEVQEFPIIWARKSDPEGLVEEARQRLMGFWAMEKNQHFPEVNPPTYEAYQRFLECVPGPYRCYLDVLSKDSTFILAHISLMGSATWREQDYFYYPSKEYVEKNIDKCTQYEKNLYLLAVNFWEGDYEDIYSYYDANYQMDTKNLIMLHQSAYAASVFLNRPDIAVERYEWLFEDYATYKEYLWHGPLYHYPDALNRTGKSQKLIDLVNQKLPKGEWRKRAPWWAWLELYVAYLHTVQLDEAIGYVDSVFQWSSNRSNKRSEFLLSLSASIWSAFHKDSLPNPIHKRIRENLNNYPELGQQGAWGTWNVYQYGAPYSLKEYQFYLLQDWEKAESEFSRMKTNPPDFSYLEDEKTIKRYEKVFELWVEAMLGNIYARQGKRDLAIQQATLLDQLKATFPEQHIPSSRGIIPYYQARIHALLGNKDQTVEYLQQSRDAGKPIIGMSFIMDYDLASLRGYEPFEELIQPKVDAERR